MNCVICSRDLGSMIKYLKNYISEPLLCRKQAANEFKG